MLKPVRHGKDRCPFHMDVLIKWEIWAKQRERHTDKAIILTWTKEGYGKIECNAMSEEGNCLKDWCPCPVDEILKKLLKVKEI